MIWAWEEPEDLRGIDPRRVGVAFLTERVFLGRVAKVIPRRQRILAPDGVYAVAVVRLEGAAGELAVLMRPRELALLADVAVGAGGPLGGD